jgi:hypothetical protein
MVGLFTCNNMNAASRILGFGAANEASECLRLLFEGVGEFQPVGGCPKRCTATQFTDSRLPPGPDGASLYLHNVTTGREGKIQD